MRIITRGMGSDPNNKPGMITQGYSGLFLKAITNGIEYVIRRGGSGVKKINELLISTKLIRVDENFNINSIKGNIKTELNDKQANVIIEQFTIKTKEIWQEFKVNVLKLF